MTRLQMSVLRCGQQTANNLRTPMIVLAWITEGLRPGRWCAPDTLRWRRIFLAYRQAEQEVGVLWSGLGLGGSRPRAMSGGPRVWVSNNNQASLHGTRPGLLSRTN